MIGPDLPRYPRTLHLEGSKGITDPNSIPFSTIADTNLVIEEKLDGSCISICFLDGELYIYHRNSVASGPEFRQLYQQIQALDVEIYSILGERYVIYGEWLYAKHTIYYDNLPHLFFEYDVFDRENNYFLSTIQRIKLALPLPNVRIVRIGSFSKLSEIASLIGPSAYVTTAQADNLRKQAGIDIGSELLYTDTTGIMEGLYIKQEDDEKVLGRYKFIRKDFVDKILDSGHWKKRALVPNLLADSSSLLVSAPTSTGHS